MPKLDANSFYVRAHGGVRLVSGIVERSGGRLPLEIGVQIPPKSSGWSVPKSSGCSDINSKTNVSIVDDEWVLEALVKVQVSMWQYQGSAEGAGPHGKGVTHMGPMAQDFNAALAPLNLGKTAGAKAGSGEWLNPGCGCPGSACQGGFKWHCCSCSVEPWSDQCHEGSSFTQEPRCRAIGRGNWSICHGTSDMGGIHDHTHICNVGAKEATVQTCYQKAGNGAMFARWMGIPSRNARRVSADTRRQDHLYLAQTHRRTSPVARRNDARSYFRNISSPVAATTAFEAGGQEGRTCWQEIVSTAQEGSFSVSFGFLPGSSAEEDFSRIHTSDADGALLAATRAMISRIDAQQKTVQELEKQVETLMLQLQSNDVCIERNRQSISRHGRIITSLQSLQKATSVVFTPHIHVDDARVRAW